MFRQPQPCMASEADSPVNVVPEENGEVRHPHVATERVRKGLIAKGLAMRRCAKECGSD